VNDKTKRPGRAALWTLVGILTVGLALRLWGFRSGLPVPFNLDEYAHFTVTAVDMFGGGLNPHYFQNPPAFTYLLHLLYSVAWLTPPVGSAGEAVHAAFLTDASPFYAIARVATALLGIGASWVLYLTGRRLWGTGVALAAAAFLTFTFLPVHYSHFALNDVPTLLPLCLGMFGVAGVIRFGRPLDYALAALGLGLATATKYTAAALALSIFVAWAIRWRDDRQRGREELKYLVLAGIGSVVVFFIVNPYALLDPHTFVYDMRRQQSLSAGVVKLGTDNVSGWAYYAWTLLWGFGVLPLLLALSGMALALKRDWRSALPLIVFAFAVFLFMGRQERFYARWMMPIYPVLALYAAYCAVELGRWLTARFRRGKPGASPTFAVVAVTALALASPLIHIVHNDRVLTRKDTRQLAKAWILKNVPPDAKIAFDLIGPKPYYRATNGFAGPPAFTIRKLPSGYQIEKYAQRLSPEVLDSFEREGYCYVVSGSTQRGRAIKDPAKAPHAAEYYAALERRGEKLVSFDPMKPGAKLPRFNFDISYNYYPLGYHRPGPRIDIYRLSGGVCAKKR
jgi:4-amino-4-deoxy-L-arabinose transferase-like glycosyltransferase